MPDRLDYIKQKLEEQKKSPAVILRHSDGEWAVSEIERLRAENELYKEFKENVQDDCEDDCEEVPRHIYDSIKELEEQLNESSKTNERQVNDY